MTNIIKFSDISEFIEDKSLLEVITNNFNDKDQEQFIINFYLYQKYNPLTDYVVELGKIYEWLGFTRLDNAKRVLIKHFKEDEDYKINYQCLLRVEETPQIGLKDKEKIMMNVNCFKKLCLKAQTEEADKIHDYYVKLENIVFQHTINEMKNLKNEISEKNEKMIELQEELKIVSTIKEKHPIVYIYNTDTRNEKALLKIGLTEHFRERTKPFKQTHPYGKIVFYLDVPEHNLRNTEQYIHNLLSPFKVKGEMFDIKEEEAKIWITLIVNQLKLTEIKNPEERLNKLNKIIEHQCDIINNIECKKISTNTISIQTEESEFITDDNKEFSNFLQKKLKEEANKYEFDKFIEECCIIDKNAEEPTQAIYGRYKIWKKETSKESHYALLDYLKTYFKPARLKQQNKVEVVNGYVGLKLKEYEYKISSTPKDYELFLASCIKLSPAGKCLQTELLNEYSEWRMRTKKDKETNKDINELKKYLNNHEYIFCTNIWCIDGKGQGYYGIVLKNKEIYNRKPNGSAKKIGKYDVEGNLLDIWNSVAKAAENEKISTTTLRKTITENIIIDDLYTYRYL